MLIESYRNI